MIMIADCWPLASAWPRNANIDVINVYTSARIDYIDLYHFFDVLNINTISINYSIPTRLSQNLFSQNHFTLDKVKSFSLARKGLGTFAYS